MHETSRRKNLDDSIARVVEPRMGKIPFSARYHRQRALGDDYIVSRNVLGSGMSGKVRMATNVIQPDEKFAVKSLRLAKLTKEEHKHLEHEVQNYLSMDHPHIARLCDVYESESQLDLVMECLEGGELFDRVEEKNRFSEEEASDAVRQMLLALNYIHSRGIVHRDLKLENLVYDKKGSTHLKLIDFGLSKRWDPNGQKRMDESCGSLLYIAPEVLCQSYTSQCDLWSVGVLGFILMSGYIPFSGSDDAQIKKICQGRYVMRPEKWSIISGEGKDFISKLLQVNPSKRLTAQSALEHPWMAKRCAAATPSISIEVVDALKNFGRISKFRRCCMEVLAWSLSNEERAKVRSQFLSLDANHSGGITWSELKHVMVDKLHAADECETLHIFEALDYNQDQEIHYSDFLAAMVDTQIRLSAHHFGSVFRRFDADSTGYISLNNLREVLGCRVQGEKVEAFMEDVNQGKDGCISFAELCSYLVKESIAPPKADDVQSMQRIGFIKAGRGVSTALSCFGGWLSLLGMMQVCPMHK
jgi:calcium-dependent protein kinase